MHVLVVNNHTVHIHEIYKLFPHNTFFTYISYEQIGGFDTRPFDCILLTGSSTHTYLYKSFAQEIHLLKELDKPIVGICLWCELIASSYDCMIVKHDDRIDGDMIISCDDDPKNHIVHESHRFSIVSLGQDIVWLWKSDYWIEIIKHRNKPIIGFQFHPEVTLRSPDWLHLFNKFTSSIFTTLPISELWTWEGTLYY